MSNETPHSEIILYQTEDGRTRIQCRFEEEATCKEYLQVRSEGGRRVSRRPLHYSLPAILAVGYRVRGHRGAQFRQWATARLHATRPHLIT